MSYCEDSNINKSYIVQTVDSSDIFSACTEIYVTNITPCTGDTININSNLNVTGNISGTTFYGDGSQLSGIITTDNYVTGGVYTASTKSLYFTGTTGFTPFSIDVSALLDDTNNYVTGGTYNPSTDIISLFRNDNVTIDITGVTDTFTTGGTYDNGTSLITFVKNDNTSYTIDLSTIDVNDTFVTGSTLNGDSLTIRRNDGVDIVVTGFSQTFTGNTNTTCIGDIYVSNIHSCSPLRINSNDEGNVYFGSTSGVTIDVINGKLGIGTSNPIYNLDVVSSGGTGSYEDIARFRTIDSTDYLALTNAISTDGTFNPVLRAFNNTNVSTNFYLQSVIDPSVDTGVNPLIMLQGRVSTDPGNVSWSGVTTRPILRVRNNSTNLLDVTADGKVGIGTTSPSESLDVDGNAIISGTINIGKLGTGTSINNLGIDSIGNVVVGTTGDTDTNTFVTGGTLSSNDLILEKNNGVDVNPINLSGLVSGKTDLTLFNSHTGDTNNPHQTSFSGLTSTAHTHTLSEITDFNTYSGSVQTQIDGKVETILFNSHTGDTNNPHDTSFSNLTSTAHTHTISDVINLQTELDGKLSVTEFNTYSGDVQTQLDGKLDVSTFNSYSGNVETELNTKISGVTNLSSEGVFAQKNGLDLEFKGVSSTGGTVNISSNSNSVNLEVTFPTDQDKFVSGGTYNTGTQEINFVGNSVDTTFDVNLTSLVSSISGDTFVSGGTLSNTDLILEKNNGINVNPVDLSGLVSGKTDLILFNTHTGDTSNPHDTSFSNLTSTAHTHTISDVINLQTELDGKLNVSEFNTYSGDVQTQIDNKLETSIFNSYTGSVVDVFVSSGNANSVTQQLSFTNTTGGTFNVTNSAALFSDNDVNVTGGTYNPSNGCVTFTTNSGTTFDVCGFVTGITDTFVTGGTLSGTDLILERSNGIDVSGIDLSSLISGKLDITTFNTYTGDTQTILNSKTDNTDFTSHTGDTTIHYTKGSINLSDLGSSAHTHTLSEITDFNTYSGNVQTQLDTKIQNGVNSGGANEVFSGNSGTDLYFRTISGGSNTTISTIGDIIKVDVSVPVDTNTFVTGFTYDDINTFTISRNNGLGDLTSTISVLSGITYYGDGSNLSGISSSDFYVTGGTFSSETLTLDRNDGGSVVVTGFTSPLWSTNVNGIHYNSGNVGIGMSASSVNTKLQIEYDDTSERALRIKNTDSNSQYNFRTELRDGEHLLRYDSDNTGITPLVLSSVNKVGVGIPNTIAPEATLHVYSTSGSQPIVLVEDETNPDATPFIIDVDGNVGIGLSATTAKLHIDGTGGSVRFNVESDYLPDGRFGNHTLFESYDTPSGSTAINIVNNVSTGSEGIAIIALSDNRYSNLAIYGENSDTAIVASSNANDLNFINSPGGSDNISFFAGEQYSATPHLHVHGSGSTKGYIGIGTATPTEKLDVSGNTKISGKLSVGTNDNTYIGQFSGSTGRVMIDTDGNRIGDDRIRSEIYAKSLDSSGLTVFNAVSDNPSYGVGLGIVGSTPVAQLGQFGEANDAFLYAYSEANNLHIVNGESIIGDKEDSLLFYAGNTPLSTPTPTLTLYGSGSTKGNVGIGIRNPQEKLDVSGNTKISGTLNIGTLGTGTSVNNLGIDSSGNVVTGTTGGGGDNFYVTGFTYNDANTFTISQNGGLGDLTSTINTMTGLTVNGTLVVDTISATTINGSISGLTLNDLDDVTTGIPTTPDNTYQGRQLYFDVASNEWIATQEYGSIGTVTIWGKKGSAGTIDKGLPVYITGFDDDIHQVELADATTATTMPVIGFTGEDFDDTTTNPIITFGKITGVNTTSTISTLNPNGETWVVNDVLYMSTTTGGLTKNRPTGTNTQIQRIAKVLKVDSNSGQLFIFNTARTAGLPNLTTDYLWLGNGNDTPQEVIKTDVGITTTGFTYDDNNTFTITDDNGGSFSSTINQMSGLTINGDLDVTGNTTLNTLTATSITSNSEINVFNGHINLRDNSYFLQGRTGADVNVSLIGVDNQDRVFVGNAGYDTYIDSDTIVDGSLTATTLNITTIGTGTLVNNLGVDVNGNVVSGNTNTGIYGGDGTIPLNTTASVNGDLTFQGLDEDTRIILKDGNNGGEVHLFSDGSAGQSALEFYNPDGATLTSKIQNAGGDTRFISNNRDLLFTTNTGVTTEGLFIEAGTGNVGIGTASPQVELHVKGNSSILRLETTSATNNNYIEFWDPTERKGFLGYVSTANIDALFIRNEEHDADIIISTTNSGGTSLTAINIDGNQDVGIPNGNLDVSGTLNIGTLGTGTSVNNLGIDSNGQVVTGTTGGGTGVSDANKVFSWFMNVT